jgi:hypothetical protein
MAKNLVLENDAANPACDAVVDLLNNGYIRIYDSEDTLLAELRFGATAFGDAVAGVATANAITADESANDTGTASYFEAYQSDGSTLMFTGTVGAGGTYDLVLNSTSIVAGVNVSISSLTFTVPLSA